MGPNGRVSTRQGTPRGRGAAGLRAERGPVRQPSQPTADTRPISTAEVPIVESSDIHLIVVLLRPAKASPITGRTGAPQPITVQPPVESPKMPPSAPSTPPDPPALRPHGATGRAARRSIQSAKYAATRRDMKAKRARSAVVTAKPHSSPNELSAENQKSARPHALVRRSPSDPRPEAR